MTSTEKEDVDQNVLLRTRTIRQGFVSIYKKWYLDDFTDVDKDTKLTVDHEQYAALRHSIPYDLTLVNGAPGTGKTHFARELLRVLATKKGESKDMILNSVPDSDYECSDSDDYGNDGPIVLITYTNHALDSFLEGVVKDEENPSGFIKSYEFTRFGGPSRSKNKTILGNMFKIYDCSTKQSRSMKYNTKELKENMQKLYSYLGIIDAFQKNVIRYRNLNHNVLVDLMMGLDMIYKKEITEFMKKYQIFQNENDSKAYKLFYLHPPSSMNEIPFLPTDFSTLISFWNDRELFESSRENYKRILNQCRSFGPYRNPFANLAEEEEDIQTDDISNEEPIPSNDINATQQQDPQEMQQEPIDDGEDEEEEDNITPVNLDADLVAIIENGFIEDSFREREGVGSEDSSFNDFIYKTQKDLMNVLESNKKKSVELFKFTQSIRPVIKKLINSLEEEINIKNTKIANIEEIEIGKMFSRLKLVAVTSTVASIHKEALKLCGCRTIIIEEAGELTESMSSCILPQTLEHLILIGDYNQLRPKVEHKLTFSPYHYDISLFEKLVQHAKSTYRHGKELYTLSVQRRMHPEISELLRRTFYRDGDEKLIDCDTMQWGVPKGIPYRVRFIYHNHDEDPAGGRSHKNVYEAKMAASLFVLFTSRGYKPEEITIVVLYKGQMYEIDEQLALLQEKLKGESKDMDPFHGKKASDIPVKVLDNFQGEENKVIIISLTRSSGLGFVKNRNRALVALSRAKEMMVVIGHEGTFGPKTYDPLWRDISTQAQKLSPYCVSNEDKPGFAVSTCPVHSHNDVISNVKYLVEPDDVIKYRFNFCNHTCNILLDCGHKCHLPCHVISIPATPEDHENYVCPENCSKRCPNNHQCVEICGNCKRKGCPKCIVMVPHRFPCGHTAEIECYKDTGDPGHCPCKCGKTIDSCGHKCSLPCGHDRSYQNRYNDYYNSEYGSRLNQPYGCKCNVQLEKNCPTCNSKIEYICGTEQICSNPCQHILECGHQCKGKCGECTENMRHRSCYEPCNFVFACGCKCPCKCSDNSYSDTYNAYSALNYYSQRNHYERHQHYICKKCKGPSYKDCNCSICRSPKRCDCQCNLLCYLCNSECHALSEEKCAFFCPHYIKENPPGDETVFCFHDNHFLRVEEAKQKIREQFRLMVGLDDEKIRPIAPLCCPIKGCSHKLEASWLFNDEIKYVRMLHDKIESLGMQEMNDRKNILQLSKRRVWWFHCSCKNVFCNEISDNCIIACPKCSKVYELA